MPLSHSMQVAISETTSPTSAMLAARSILVELRTQAVFSTLIAIPDSAEEHYYKGQVAAIGDAMDVLAALNVQLDSLQRRRYDRDRI